MRSGAQVARGVQTLEADVPYADDGHAVLDVKANLTTALTEGLAQLGAEDPVDVRRGVHGPHPHRDRSRAGARGDAGRGVRSAPAGRDDVAPRPPGRNESGLRSALARSITGVTAAGAQHSNVIPATTGKGSRSSEGDLTHLAVAARAAFRHDRRRHQDRRPLRRRPQPRGQPGVRRSRSGQGDWTAGAVRRLVLCDEGTAMLEIIHDLAPGAELYFASGMVSITSFADNIRALRAAGCDIIVDDLFYFVETPFQDGQAPGIVSNSNGGVVIQAVKDVTASGALYFSSAGNSGNFNDGTSGAWEGDFVDGGPTTGALSAGAGRLHSWGGQNFNLLRAANVDAPITLYWSDPLGGSSNDYDLFRLNSAGTAVSASSTNIQNGTQDPIEQVSQSMASAAHCHRQEDGRAVALPSPGNQPRPAAVRDAGRDARPRRRRCGRRLWRRRHTRRGRLPEPVRRREPGRDVQLGRPATDFLRGGRHGHHAGQPARGRRQGPAEAGFQRPRMASRSAAPAASRARSTARRRRRPMRRRSPRS